MPQSKQVRVTTKSKKELLSSQDRDDLGIDSQAGNDSRRIAGTSSSYLSTIKSKVNNRANKTTQESQHLHSSLRSEAGSRDEQVINSYIVGNVESIPSR